MALADRIQSRLEATGLSANAASTFAGLGRDYVRDILRGKVKEPSADRLDRLATVLGCSLAYLLGSSDEPGVPTPYRDIHFTTLPVSYRIRPGFHLDDDGSMPIAFDWPVSPLTDSVTNEWLEYVEDPSGGAPVPRGALLHMSMMSLAVRDNRDLLIVITRTADGGRLLERSVRCLTRLGDGSYRLTPWSDGDKVVRIAELVLQENHPERHQHLGFTFAGFVRAVYDFRDGAVEDRVRELTRIST